MSRDRRPGSSASDAALEQAAADWITRLDRGLTPEEAVQFAAWEAADPRHRAELALMRATWRRLDTADEVSEIMQCVAEMEAQESRQARERRYRRVLAGAGLAAVLAVAGTALLRAPRAREASASPAAAASSRSYQVVPSTAQRLPLADGSLVELRADSQVETAFSPTERRVWIVRGEAYFTVAKDPGRPFVVQAGKVAVRAVGTAFNVRLAPDVVEVLVTEGQVRVHDSGTHTSLLAAPEPAGDSAGVPPPLLSAGQRILVPADVPLAVPTLAATAEETERTLTWRSAQLVFERTSLEEAVAAFNSFNRHQLVLGDPALRTRRLGGTFRADNIEAFVRLLKTGFDITAEPRGELEIVLHSSPVPARPE